ncbi:MAG: hypothetical protein AAGA58_07545 [Verrucomicrobiota bacterium]
MDRSFVEEAIESNQPFTVRTAAGDSYHVPHRDFISFSAKRTTLIISYEKDGSEKVAYVPLLTATAVEVDSKHEGV